MSTPDYYLLGKIRVPGYDFRPGAPFFKSRHSAAVASAVAASGLAWPGSDATVAAASAVTAKLVLTGKPDDELSAIMIAAAAASAKASGWTELTATVGFADFSGLGSATTKDYLLGGVLPAGARLAALPVVEGWTGFDDATHAVESLTVGTALGGAQVGASTAVDVMTGTGFPKSMAAGGYVGMALGGAQLSARITSAVHLSTLTAGALAVKVFYTVQP